MPAVKVIGLTGGIGSGKSTVSNALAAKGAVIVDADSITKELQQPGQPVFLAMVERFGGGVVAADGNLNRQAIADIVFNDPEALKDLNKIVHPAVITEIIRRVDEQRGTDKIVVLDIPLLQNDGRYPIQAFVVVDAPHEVAVERLVTFRGLREDDAWARISRQISREERLSVADRVLDNSGAPEALTPQIDELWAWFDTLPEAPPKKSAVS